MFSVLQWARIMSPFRLLAADDRVSAWFEAMLDAHDGYGRSHPAAGPVPQQAGGRGVPDR